MYMYICVYNNNNHNIEQFVVWILVVSYELMLRYLVVCIEMFVLEIKRNTLNYLQKIHTYTDKNSLTHTHTHTHIYTYIHTIYIYIY